MITVHVEAAVAGRKRAGSPGHELHVSLPGGPTALRDLIEAIVRAEVGAFLERTEGRKLVRVLTEEALEDGLATGSVRSGGREVVAEVNAEKAVCAAIDAQRDGLFQAIVDEEPIDDLDTVIEVRDGTRVTFLRLVALVGG